MPCSHHQSLHRIHLGSNISPPPFWLQHLSCLVPTECIFLHQHLHLCTESHWESILLLQQNHLSCLVSCNRITESLVSHHLAATESLVSWLHLCINSLLEQGSCTRCCPMSCLALPCFNAYISAQNPSGCILQYIWFGLLFWHFHWHWSMDIWFESLNHWHRGYPCSVGGTLWKYRPAIGPNMANIGYF